MVVFFFGLYDKSRLARSVDETFVYAGWNSNYIFPMWKLPVAIAIDSHFNASSPNCSDSSTLVAGGLRATHSAVANGSAALKDGPDCPGTSARFYATDHISSNILPTRDGKKIIFGSVDGYLTCIGTASHLNPTPHPLPNNQTLFSSNDLWCSWWRWHLRPRLNQLHALGTTACLPPAVAALPSQPFMYSKPSPFSPFSRQTPADKSQCSIITSRMATSSQSDLAAVRTSVQQQLAEMQAKIRTKAAMLAAQEKELESKYHTEDTMKRDSELAFLTFHGGMNHQQLLLHMETRRVFLNAAVDPLCQAAPDIKDAYAKHLKLITHIKENLEKHGASGGA